MGERVKTRFAVWLLKPVLLRELHHAVELHESTNDRYWMGRITALDRILRAQDGR